MRTDRETSERAGKTMKPRESAESDRVPSCRGDLNAKLRYSELHVKCNRQHKNYLIDEETHACMCYVEQTQRGTDKKTPTPSLRRFTKRNLDIPTSFQLVATAIKNKSNNFSIN